MTGMIPMPTNVVAPSLIEYAESILTITASLYMPTGQPKPDAHLNLPTVLSTLAKMKDALIKSKQSNSNAAAIIQIDEVIAYADANIDKINTEVVPTNTNLIQDAVQSTQNIDIFDMEGSDPVLASQMEQMKSAGTGIFAQQQESIIPEGMIPPAQAPVEAIPVPTTGENAQPTGANFDILNAIDQAQNGSTALQTKAEDVQADMNEAPPVIQEALTPGPGVTNAYDLGVTGHTQQTSAPIVGTPEGIGTQGLDFVVEAPIHIIVNGAKAPAVHTCYNADEARVTISKLLRINPADSIIVIKGEMVKFTSTVTF